MSPVQMIAVRRFSSLGTGMDTLLQSGLVLTYRLTMLIPLGFAILIARGRFVGLAERLTPLFATRRRAGVLVALLGTVIMGMGRLLPFVWGPNPSYGFPVFGLVAVMVGGAAIQGVIFGLLTAWLMPKPLSAQIT